VKEAEEQVLQDAITQAKNEKIQNITRARLKEILEKQRKVVIEPVCDVTESDKENRDINRPILISQEADSISLKIVKVISNDAQRQHLGFNC
jgi:hypothetical protein